jgi:outer membrane protein assembly factor BamA
MSGDGEFSRTTLPLRQSMRPLPEDIRGSRFILGSLRFPTLRKILGFPVFFVCLLFFLPSVAAAQLEVPARDSMEVGGLSITGYPYIFYSPETEFALGGALIFTQRLGTDPGVKASNAMLSGYYSVKKSFDLFLNPEFFLGDDKYYVTASFDYYRYVDKFWGIGPSSPDIDSVGYVRNAFWMNIECDVSVLGPLKVGLNYDLNTTAIADKGTNPYILAGDLTGTDGGLSSGIGIVLFADTRNNAFSPSDGGFYKLSVLNAAPWLGSKFTFIRYNLDVRQYIRLIPQLVLALQFYGSAIDGSPPFYMLPALGGDNIMRGYYEGRYRDKIYAAVQAELRARITNRWGLVGFFGLGDVSGDFQGFRLKSVKPSFGLGVRFMLDTNELLNVRADFARGRDTDGIYFNAKEAF